MSEPAAAAADAVTEAEGPAFPVLLKWLTTAMTGAVFASGAMAWGSPALQSAALSAKLLFAAGLALMLLFTVCVWRSRSRVSAREVTQTWVWHKRVAWADVTQARLIHIRALAWLIAPRLVVRHQLGMVTMFHAADPHVIAAFTRYAVAPQLRESAPAKLRT